MVGIVGTTGDGLSENRKFAVVRDYKSPGTRLNCKGPKEGGVRELNKGEDGGGLKGVVCVMREETGT